MLPGGYPERSKGQGSACALAPHPGTEGPSDRQPRSPSPQLYQPGSPLAVARSQMLPPFRSGRVCRSRRVRVGVDAAVGSGLSPLPPPPSLMEALARCWLRCPCVPRAGGTARRSEGTEGRGFPAGRDGSQAPRRLLALGEAPQRSGGWLQPQSAPTQQLGSQITSCAEARLTRAPGSLPRAVPRPQSCSRSGGRGPGRSELCFPAAGTGGFQLFSQVHVTISPLFTPDPLSRGSHQPQGSPPVAFLRVDVAFLPSRILIRLEFVNHISPKLSTTQATRVNQARQKAQPGPGVRAAPGGTALPGKGSSSHARSCAEINPFSPVFIAALGYPQGHECCFPWFRQWEDGAARRAGSAGGRTRGDLLAASATGRAGAGGLSRSRGCSQLSPFSDRGALVSPQRVGKVRCDAKARNPSETNPRLHPKDNTTSKSQTGRDAAGTDCPHRVISLPTPCISEPLQLQTSTEPPSSTARGIQASN